VRELREELGIDIDPGALHRLGVRRVVDETPEGTNREFCHVFLVLDDRPLDAYRPDPSEIAAVVEVGLDAALDLFAGRLDAIDAVEVAPGGDRHRRALAIADFVPEAPLVDVAPSGERPYWLTVLTMGQRLAGGETRLSI
jgi:8-oxo-dGTP pyrophosphatase MutT (NUDIX family)